MAATAQTTNRSKIRETDNPATLTIRHPMTEGVQLTAVERNLANLVDALAEGFRGAGVQAKRDALDWERNQLAQAIQQHQPPPVRLMPNLGHAWRRTRAGLKERLAGPEHDAQARELVRQLIEKVVIHAAPPRKPPGITVEGRLERMLTTARPGPPDHAAHVIADAARLSDKPGPGAWALGGRGLGRPEPSPAAPPTSPPPHSAP